MGVSRISGIMGSPAMYAAYGAYNASALSGAASVSRASAVSDAAGSSDDVKKAGRVSSPSECKTCKERKYKDGSDESDVSFQTPQSVTPGTEGARVRAHEQEHVANAYEKASKGGGKVLQASVALHTAICPECGRVYVAGGTTTTRIAYPNEENPYQKERKKQHQSLLAGSRFDAAV